ncbi:amidohydrolase family protein [Ketogulonicigenium vulgare]|uniref:Amidohydrolase:Amidohydrolase-like protein n=1 Tax=Ketogulonicigenium vulgare (strain WSH-001) TaxID=759362 RepID=F9Y955_KETVW|nr:amidohydrolase family protein [Ketogulonicigenium vulgare]ADO43092.1 5-methylthioadenosine/S-adenosylhomocysteine deaminase [Ketogulonicigenium vulgare Y25]AEM41272.1 Amidohydrolase:Amidohydrolase-like protein [Ketogulonicigenium vulgare WSH-001]ALJ81410.1 amidohydrolase [Ketogulonicigenium vulgare]ANW35080.1 amidohydrolase [Ketogulonicigenium vulgare]AOZ55005.1 5-methylthioadenosine/S-adenosylhomocysteine deaminase [Ketogulonicigenium vulgare]
MSQTLIRNATIVTMDKDDRILANAAILFEGETIKAIGETAIAGAGHDAQVIDATDKIIIPGLINAHIHMWQTALRGYGMDWTGVEHHLHMQTEFVPVFTPDQMRLSEFAGGLSLLNGGVTSVFEWCHGNRTPDHSDAAIEGLQDAGIRSLFIHGTVKTLPHEGEVHFSQVPHPAAEARRLRARHSSDGGMMGLALGILGPDYSPVEICRQDFALADELGLWSSAHVSGKPGKVEGGYRRLKAEGILTGKHNVVHANSMEDDEIALLLDNDCTITATSSTEISGGSKAPLVSRVIALGGRPSIGNDSESAMAGSMLEAMRQSLMIDRLFHNISRDAVSKGPGQAATNAVYRGMPLPPRKNPGAYEALKWATIDNAKSVGMEAFIGSLELGKKADIVMVDALAPNLTPGLDPVEAVVGYADAANIEAIWVNGTLQKWDFKLLNPSARSAAKALRDTALTVLENAGRRELITHRFTG